MDQPWTILIYTVPAAPSRKRAAIWRELKKVGVVYLRDGVCVLPARGETTAGLRAIAARVEGFDGEATLVEAARLDPRRAAAIVDQSRRDRAAEYAEIAREAEGFLEHIRREMAHREFTLAEVEELEVDREKLRRWAGQVRARDYFGGAGAARLEELLGRCDEALGTFLEEASRRDEMAR
ncbi:MAG: hypothetical protein M3Q65_12130 [Chloroflexota bacterium]|nr:hypothetical protein [Chloroflexota bacterium]